MSYLSDRTLLYGDSGRREVTSAVPQESVFGPLPPLWTVIYDDLLRVDLPGNVQGSSSAFADDVTVLATGYNTNLLVQAMNPALEAVAVWTVGRELSLPVSKSVAAMLISREYRSLSASISGTASWSSVARYTTSG